MGIAARKCEAVQTILNGRSLLQLCLDVHMSKTGAMEQSMHDSISDEWALQFFISNWEESNSDPSREAFDKAVLELCKAAVKEPRR